MVSGRFDCRPDSLVTEQDANLVHYSGYSEDELKPTAQLMLDYVVRTSQRLTAWSQIAADTGEVENPLELNPEDHEYEHPNFIKKYGAKKVTKSTVSRVDACRD